MAAKKVSMSNLDNIGAAVNEKAANIGGRPRLNPHNSEKKITTHIPAKVHRQLRLASAYTGRPMVAIVVDALVKHLAEYEGK